MAEQSVALEHAAIGTINGIRRVQGVDQFLGIQYAKLTNRFARGTFIETYTTPVDGTTQGPIPVAHPSGCDNEHLLLQHDLPHPTYRFSDTECLNLNVSIPSPGANKTPGALLPVLVFVHGGGFVTGSGSWPQWDLAAIVKKSVVDSKTPIIAVGINYRLGHFGFLTSTAMRDAGYLPNNGLHDQKLSFRWIQKYIQGFGGDPNKVTFLGSSIGGAAGFIHLQNEERLFDRLSAMGGSPLIRSFPPEVAEIAFGMVTKALGLDSLPPAEQVKTLLEIPAGDLEAKLRDLPAPVGAVVDGDIVRDITTYQALANVPELAKAFPGIRWIKDILIGDCEFDGMVFGATALAGRKDDLAVSLETSLNAALKIDSAPVVIKSILSLYGLDNPGTMDSHSKLVAVLRFMNDIGFAQGARATALAWSLAHETCGTTSFLSHFNCPNPWSGPWEGYGGTHALDAAFMLQNFNDHLSEGQRSCTDKMALNMIKFVNGEEPFPPFAEDGIEMVYDADVDGTGDKCASVSATTAASKGRRAALEGLVGTKPEYLDQLIDALGLVLQGPR